MTCVIVMGPAGAGKTTVGQLLAARLGWIFEDADAVHPKSNVAKMRAGTRLTDEDRWPWLDALHARLARSAARGESMVLACSALKQSYRDRLTRAVPDTVFVHLKADPHTLRRRLEERRGHYMGAELLASQLATLEEPAHAIVVDATLSPDHAVDTIVRALNDLSGAAMAQTNTSTSTDPWITRYAASHQHPVNRACHTVGIPLIVVSLVMFVVSAWVSGFWKLAAAVFLVGWIFQFVGHYFEGKPPEFFHDWRFLFVGLRWWIAKMKGRA